VDLIVASQKFSFFMSVAIFLNSVCIGFEIELELREGTGEALYWLSLSEHLFLVIYVTEISMVLFSQGRKSLKNNWIRFDAVLVLIGVTTTWVVLPIINAMQGQKQQGGSMMSLFDQILILRLLRLLRLARALRLITCFESLAKLVQGMLSSFNTMLSAIAVIALSVYIMACVGAELITKTDLKNDPVAGPVIEDRFGSLPDIFLTLFQFTNDDSLSGFYVPLIKRNPWLALYFLVSLVVVSFTLMNMVTAIVVEDSIDRARKDEELMQVRTRRQLKGYQPVIQAVFRELDTSSDNVVDLREILAGLGHIQTKIPVDLASALDPERLVDLFEYIDTDGSGTLSEDEFVEGVGHLAISGIPVETFQTLALLRELRRNLTRVAKKVETIWQVLEAPVGHPAGRQDRASNESGLDKGVGALPVRVKRWAAKPQPAT
jgi:hypothetical protein